MNWHFLKGQLKKDNDSLKRVKLETELIKALVVGAKKQHFILVRDQCSVICCGIYL